MLPPSLRAAGLDIRYDLDPLLGCRIPDLDLTTTGGPVRTYSLVHEARHVLVNLGGPLDVDLAPWNGRVRRVDARHDGTVELPVIGAVPDPPAVVIPPDGYVAWVRDGTADGLVAAITTWAGPAARTLRPERPPTARADRRLS